jgi:hypothetical protein
VNLYNAPVVSAKKIGGSANYYGGQWIACKDALDIENVKGMSAAIPHEVQEAPAFGVLVKN